MKNTIINISIMILCICAICINTFWGEYKALGSMCIIIMGILAFCKDKKQ